MTDTDLQQIEEMLALLFDSIEPPQNRAAVAARFVESKDVLLRVGERIRELEAELAVAVSFSREQIVKRGLAEEALESLVAKSGNSAPDVRADAEAKADGESWADYAHRLESRIKAQREHIDGLIANHGDGNRAARRRTENVKRALANMTVRWEAERSQKRYLLAREDDGALTATYRAEMAWATDRANRMENALAFWVARADEFEAALPETKRYKAARGVLSKSYAVGRALADVGRFVPDSANKNEVISRTGGS